MVFDFDGVFTDNKVYVSDNGRELVCCSRADGLGIEFLRMYAKMSDWPLQLVVLTRELNRSVLQRCEKLGITCIQGVFDKRQYLVDNLEMYSIKSLQHVIYLGNDLNDYKAMKECGLSIAPRDSHGNILDIADIVIDADGGNGFIRKFVEHATPMVEYYCN